MRKEEAIELIKNQRSAEWNAYRKMHPDWIPDLSNIDLTGVYLVPNRIGFDLSKANLCGTRFDTRLNYLIYDNTHKVVMKNAIINSRTVFPAEFNSYSIYGFA